jgi:hypothetical protein
MNLRIADLEFRHTEQRRPEIVAWNSPKAEPEYCYTLLWWRRDAEGWQCEFVGRRPFDFSDQGKLWALMCYGQDVLDALYKLDHRMES